MVKYMHLCGQCERTFPCKDTATICAKCYTEYDIECGIMLDVLKDLVEWAEKQGQMFEDTLGGSKALREIGLSEYVPDEIVQARLVIARAECERTK